MTGRNGGQRPSVPENGISADTGRGYRGRICLYFGQLTPAEGQMRIGSVLLLVWLVIGAIADGQRGYYSGPVGSCTRAGTIAITILAGPLNYLGVNPKISCTVPKPSK